MRTITRNLEAHSYGPGVAQLQAAQAPVAHVFVHPDGGGVTPVSASHAPLFAADGAPFYNSGYVYPQHGPLQTGGFPSLRLPQQAAMIDLTDMSTWDRPVFMLDAH